MSIHAQLLMFAKFSLVKVAVLKVTMDCATPKLIYAMSYFSLTNFKLM